SKAIAYVACALNAQRSRARLTLRLSPQRLKPLPGVTHESIASVLPDLLVSFRGCLFARRATTGQTAFPQGLARCPGRRVGATTKPVVFAALWATNSNGRFPSSCCHSSKRQMVGRLACWFRRSRNRHS